MKTLNLLFICNLFFTAELFLFQQFGQKLLKSSLNKKINSFKIKFAHQRVFTRMTVNSVFEEDLPKYGALLNDIEHELEQISEVVKKVDSSIENELSNHKDGIELFGLKVPFIKIIFTLILKFVELLHEHVPDRSTERRWLPTFWRYNLRLAACRSTY